MKLRTANKNDIQLLKYWDTKEHVIASGGSDDTLDWEKEVPRNVDWRKILVAEENKEPIGVIVVIDPKEEETHYWGDIEPNLLALDIWIGEEENLNRGYGTQMMNLVLNMCFENQNIEAVLVDPLISNLKAHKFYEKLGFKRTAQRFFEDDECFIYMISRSEWEKRLV